MPRRELLALDNEVLQIAASSPTGTPGAAIINNSDTPNGTIFVYQGGAPVTVAIDDIRGRGNDTRQFDDDDPNRHVVLDGAGLVADGTRVESESRITLRALDENGNLVGDRIDIFVFSQNGVAQDIWGIGLTAPLEPGVSYVKVAGSNNGDSDYRDFVPCFMAGTRIRTPDGLRPVEALRPGDRVWTRDDPEARIRWVGQTVVDGRDALAPVEIGTGVLGAAAPLRVSPQHRILMRAWQAELLFGVPEVLLAATSLTALPGVRRVPKAQVRYCHFLCESHAIVEAEGCLSESLYPGEMALDALDGLAQAELLQLFPELRMQAGYGPMAARALRAHEAAALLAA